LNKEPSNRLNVEEFSKRYVDKKYPHIVLTSINDALPLTISDGLLPGELPLHVRMNGVQKQVREISESAFNIERLLRVVGGNILYVKSETEEHVVQRVADYILLA
jgi:hypothetical protein